MPKIITSLSYVCLAQGGCLYISVFIYTGVYIYAKNYYIPLLCMFSSGWVFRLYAKNYYIPLVCKLNQTRQDNAT